MATQQIDLGVIQSTDPRQPLRPLEMTLHSLPVDTAQGIRASAQRYVIRLLSDGVNGTHNNLTRSLQRGLIWNRGYLQHLFNIENNRVLGEAQAADADSETYGALPSAQRLTSANLTDVQILPNTTTLALTIELKFGDGSTLPLNIPISTESK